MALRNIWFSIGRLVAAVVISFFLLTAVSMLHAQFGPSKEAKSEPEQRAIEAEIIRKEPPPEKKVQQKVRQVTTQSQGSKAGSGDRMAMKFSPDLGLDAGPASGEGVALQGNELEAEVFDEGQTDEDVVPEYTPQVPYPDRARDQGIEGEFVAIIVIGHNGKVLSIDISKSPHQSISSEARKVMATWRFKPAKNKGVPVNVRKRVVFDFTLN